MATNDDQRVLISGHVNWKTERGFYRLNGLRVNILERNSGMCQLDR
ncbi:unnamed protein product [Porites lobata]|uniref:Uncharacterized protein n=1 Tax=Porites lobata TaxID=104759 RepID=A0ABN8RWL7_9CNID|nr:unnamed protein product [Porites lobata]